MSWSGEKTPFNGASYAINTIYRKQNTCCISEQELLTLPEHLSSTPLFSGVRVTRSLVCCVMFCGSLFVVLSFCLLAIAMCFLSFFDLRLLITTLVYSNFSYSKTTFCKLVFLLQIFDIF